MSKTKEPVAAGSTVRGKEYRGRCKALGYTRREYQATPEEHEKLKAFLKELRHE